MGGNWSWGLPFADRWSAASAGLLHAEYEYSTFCRRSPPLSVLINTAIFVALAQLSHALAFVARALFLASDVPIPRQDIIALWLPVGFAMVLVRRVGLMAYPSIFIGMCFSGPDVDKFYLPFGSLAIASAFSVAVVIQVAIVHGVWHQKTATTSDVIHCFILTTIGCSWIALAVVRWCGMPNQGPFFIDLANWLIGDLVGGLAWRFWWWPALTVKVRLAELDEIQYDQIRQVVAQRIKRICWERFGRDKVEHEVDGVMNSATLSFPYGRTPSSARICAEVIKRVEGRLFDEDWGGEDQ